MTTVGTRIPWWWIGGVAALAGGCLWGAKSASILLTGYQPPLVFDLAPVLFSLTVLSLASGGTSGRARISQAVGGAACVSSLVALGSELTGEHWGPALAIAQVCIILGLTMTGLVTRREPGPAGAAGGMALLLGVATVPAALAGGVLSSIGERLLESAASRPFLHLGRARCPDAPGARPIGPIALAGRLVARSGRAPRLA